MIRDFALLFRIGVIFLSIIISSVLIIVSFYTKNKTFSVMFKMLSVILIASTFFCMFFFGTYVKIDSINENSVEKIWTALYKVNYNYDSEASIVTNWDVFSYSQNRDDYCLLIEKWNTLEDVDLSYWCEAHNYRENGLTLIYNQKKDYIIGERFEWVISPLAADKSKDDFYAFTGWYNGSFIIKQKNTYIRCSYTIKTSENSLASFMCVPPNDFDIASFVIGAINNS